MRVVLADNLPHVSFELSLSRLPLVPLFLFFLPRATLERSLMGETDTRPGRSIQAATRMVIGYRRGFFEALLEAQKTT